MIPVAFNHRYRGRHAVDGPVLRAGLGLLVVLLVGGCAGLGEGVDRVSLPPDAPALRDILGDLAANDEAIQSFRGAGTFILESPDFDAIKKFRGSIRFRRPADLYVQGNHRLTNIPIFKLTSAGTEFLMEFPGSRDKSFYQVEGGQYEDVPFSVSPSDVAAEMFLPEQWAALKRREVRLISFDEASGTAVVAIGSRAAPRRTIEVVQVNASAPRWVVVRNVRLDEEGRVLAETTLSGYNQLEGALFPTTVSAWFPTETTRMEFRMRNVRLNTEIANDYFDVRGRARELNLAARDVDETPKAGEGR